MERRTCTTFFLQACKNISAFNLAVLRIYNLSRNYSENIAIHHCYLFLAVFGRRFWTLSDGLIGILPFCLTFELIGSLVFRPSVSIRFADFSSGSFSSGRHRSTDVDEELSPSPSRRDRFDVAMNLLFADFILRRRASVPSKLSPVKTIDINSSAYNNTTFTTFLNLNNLVLTAEVIVAGLHEILLLNDSRFLSGRRDDHGEVC